MFMFCLYYIYGRLHIITTVLWAALWQALQVNPLTSYGASHVLLWPIRTDPPPLQATGYISHVFLKGMHKVSNSNRIWVPRLEGSDCTRRTRVTIHNLHSISYRLQPLTGSRGSGSKASSLHSSNTTWWPWPLVTQKRSGSQKCCRQHAVETKEGIWGIQTHPLMSTWNAFTQPISKFLVSTGAFQKPIAVTN